MLNTASALPFRAVGCFEAGGLVVPEALEPPGDARGVAPAQQQPPAAAIFDQVSQIRSPLLRTAHVARPRRWAWRRVRMG